MEHFPTINRLHTDVLEEKYGPIEPEIVRHDKTIREVYLNDSQGIARTYALTFFPDSWESEDIQAIDDEIRNGGSIGKTFKKHGYEIRKNVIAVFVLDVPTWLQERFRSEKPQAKARFSEFYAKKEGNEPVIYATVLEVYSPDFREAEVNSVDETQINPVTLALEKNGIDKIDVWNRITSGNDWKDLNDKYQKARIDGISETEALKMKVLAYIFSKR
jgi:hypothetical protein